MRLDAVVIGAGAAGMFCASVLGQRGCRVLLIDHAKVLGEKIRISGGGRCNFTNLHSQPEHFLSLHPGFVRSALARYTPKDFIALVQRYGIAFHEKHQGQLFCNGPSTQIIEMLLKECGAGQVQIQHPVTVKTVARAGDQWRVDTSAGSYQSSSLVIATGGLPVPAIGATGFALDLARELGMAVTPVRPGLVPLAFTSESFQGMDALSGLSVPVRISAGRKDIRYGQASFSEDLLITHKGLSGPAVLQASSYWEEGETIGVDWADGQDLERLWSESSVGAKTTEGVLAMLLPERLAKTFAEKSQLQGRKWAELGKKDRQLVQQMICRWAAKPAGTLGWKKAEVMLGGIDASGLNSKTMMAKNLPGLYCIGECVDVTGHLGGHNFQWAWASGYACAMAISCIVSASKKP
jgi:predicted Rossmann fold flavoprotein